MIAALGNHLWQSTLFCLHGGPAYADAAQKSRGGTAFPMARRVSEIPGSVFDTGEHRRPGRMAQSF
jgi:hypothetical protein